jgi:hypothetical protein
MTPQIVQAPSLVAPRYGLLVSARDSSTEDPLRSESITWTPNTCGTGGIVGICDDDAKTLADDNPGTASFRAFGIWQGYRCSTFGPTEAEREARARALLAVKQSYLVERAFWRGDYTDSGDTDETLYADNVSLSAISGDEILTPGVTTTPLVYGLAALEEAIGSCGGRAMIHASVPTVVGWYSAQAIRREGNLLLTALDNIVVPGSGYDGSSPAGAVDATGNTAWAYATPLVEYRLGNVRVLGVTPETGIDRQQNSREVRAERLVALTLEPCCRFGANIDLCSTFCVP